MQKLFILPDSLEDGLQPKAILMENWNKEPGPTLPEVLPLFVSVINTLRAKRGCGSTSREPGSWDSLSGICWDGSALC